MNFNYNYNNTENYLETFLELSRNIIDLHAPSKKKSVRGNQSPFMNKELSKAIMTRSRLRNKFNKSKSIEDKIKYNKQRNFCVSLLRRTKRVYYENLDEKLITDNKKFWKTVKPFLSDKSMSNEKITLIENEEIITEDLKIAEILNSYFSNIVANLNIRDFSHPSQIKEPDLNDPILNAINHYKYHPSIIAINNFWQNSKEFSFSLLSREELIKEISNMDCSKAVQNSDIPTKIIKNNKEFFADFFLKNINECITSGKFPATLKKGEILPILKKGSKHCKKNYRPISILPNVSKLFERPIYNQMYLFFDGIFSKFQCGFRKNFSAQDCLIALLEKWRSASDNGKAFGALLTDLSKAFDCLPHRLLIAKLHAYGFTYQALTLIYNYLTGRKQCTKINNSYSSWINILFGVPQGSILGPLLFNIFICDLFIIMDDIDFASYADDNTPYTSGSTIPEVIVSLKDISSRLFKWFNDNQMKANPEKCHLLLNSSSTWTITLEGNDILNSKCEKLLGVNFDCGLSFKEHITTICKKASNKLHALSRVSPYMSIKKKKTLMNAFFLSQFSYCPIIWMFHSRSLNSKINNLHERCLRVIYNDKKSTFKELLCLDNSVTIHERNLQRLAIELYKVHNNIAADIVSEIFPVRHETFYNTRNNSYFLRPRINTSRFGRETVSYLGPVLWDMIPTEYKNKSSLFEFKNVIKKWTPDFCPCRCCKSFIANVGFI